MLSRACAALQALGLVVTLYPGTKVTALFPLPETCLWDLLSLLLLLEEFAISLEVRFNMVCG